MKIKTTNYAKTKLILLKIWARCIPLLHISLNFAIVLFLCFNKQSRLNQIIDQNTYSSESIAFFVFFASSLVFFIVSWLIDPGYLTEKQSKKFEEMVRYKSAKHDLTPLSDHEEIDVDKFNSNYDHVDSTGLVNFGPISQDADPFPDYSRNLSGDDEDDDDYVDEDEDDYHSLQNDNGSIGLAEESRRAHCNTVSSLGNHGNNITETDYEDDAAQSDNSVEQSALLVGTSTNTINSSSRIKSTLVAADTTMHGNNSNQAKSRNQQSSSGKWSRLKNLDDEFPRSTEYNQATLHNSTVKGIDSSAKDIDLESINSENFAKNSCFGRRRRNPKLHFPFGRQVQYCKICKIYKPLRAKHCDECKHCIVKFDHHCPWMNNCIGERNHRYFLTFLFLQCIVIWWSFRFILVSFKEGGDWLEWTKNNGIYMIFFMTVMMGGVPATGLLIFHFYLMSTGVTTWELVSRSHISYLRDLPSDMNPFDKGGFRNCLFFLCRPYPVNWNQMYCEATDELRRKIKRAILKDQKKNAKKRKNLVPPAANFTMLPENEISNSAACVDKAWITSDDLKIPPLKSPSEFNKNRTKALSLTTGNYPVNGTK